MSETQTVGTVRGDAVNESEEGVAPTAPTTDGRGGGEADAESDAVNAPDPSTGRVASERGEESLESEADDAPYRRYAPHTHKLRFYARWWFRWRGELQALRQQAGHEVPDIDIEDVERLKARWGRRAKKQLIERHPLGPWLDTLPGLAGPTTAYLVGIISDPWRFPGQPCQAIRDGIADHGWYARPLFDVGDPCPMHVGHQNDPYEPCGAPLLAPREHTGVRSLRRYFGLAPGCTKKKGASAGYRTLCKGLLLAPDSGIAGQIVRHGPEPYRSIYETQKARLIRERGFRSDGKVVAPEDSFESDAARERPSPSHTNGAGGGDVGSESDTLLASVPPLIKLEKTARRKAVDQFVGDLLMEWKDRQPLGSY